MVKDFKSYSKSDAKQEIEKFKSVVLTIVEAEENAVIIKVDGWRMRAYFDESLSKEDKHKYAVGRDIEVSYTGDIEDVHSIKLLTLK